jgi:hypothetical protein
MHDVGKTMSGLLLASAMPLLVTASPLVRATIDGRNLTLRAVWSKSTPELVPASPSSSLSPTGKPLGLVFGGDACRPIRTDATREPFILFVRAGGCSSDAKMSSAINAGATAIIYADDFATEYNVSSSLSLADPASSTPAPAPASMDLVDPCLVKCDMGRGMVDSHALSTAEVLSGLPGRCPAPSGYNGRPCPTSLCAFSSAANGTRAREVCCVLALPPEPVDLQLHSRETATALPAISLNVPAAHALERACLPALSPVVGGGVRLSACRVSLVDEDDPAQWDGSNFLTWLVGTCVAAVAAKLAADEHHRQDACQEEAEAEGGGTAAAMSASAKADLSGATIDPNAAYTLIVFASGGLLAMYFLVQLGLFNIVLGINIMFVFASSSAIAQLLTIPHASSVLPPAVGRLPVRLPSILGVAGDEASLSDVAGGLAALALGLLWFLMRRDPWAWLLQDAMAACICVLFVSTIRVSSLRVGALFLGLFFCYDIFMVFISPLIFHKSVMLEVATAGRSKHTLGEYGECVRTLGDSMPLLFKLPRLSEVMSSSSTIAEAEFFPPTPPQQLPAGQLQAPDWAGNSASGSYYRGGGGGGRYGERQSFWWRLSGAHDQFAMIGLGDIVLPALLIAFARRLDLVTAAKRRLGSASTTACGYYAWAVIGYGAGLFVTLCANIYGWTFNGVQGQPALLYLVPGVVGAIFLRSLLLHDVTPVWEGSPLPQPPEDLSNLGCDGCRGPMLLGDTVWSDPSKDVDYCAACYPALPAEKRGELTEQFVYQRCGIDPPPRKREGASPPAGAMLL